MADSKLTLADLHEEIIAHVDEIQNFADQSVECTEDNSFTIGTFNWDFIELQDYIAQIQDSSAYINKTILEIVKRIP